MDDAPGATTSFRSSSLMGPASAAGMAPLGDGAGVGAGSVGGSGGVGASGAGQAFQTTYGFTTTHGFSVSSGPKPQPPPPLLQQQQRQQQKQQQQAHSDHPSRFKQEQEQQQHQQRRPDRQRDDAAGEQRGVLPVREADSVRSCSSLSTASTLTAAGALAVRVPSTDNTLGWRGMLEASKATVGSGVLGAVTAGDDGPLAPRLDLCCTAHATPGVKRLVKSVVRGLKACQDPQRMAEGMGGSYVCFNEAGRKVAIFKPCDEEPLAPNNPKGYVGRTLGDAGWKPTVRVGEAALREVAAYLLDRGHFARVPHTTLVRASHSVFHYAQQQHLLVDQPPAGGGGGGRDDSSTGAECGDVPTATAPAPAGLPPKLGSLQEFVSHLSDTSELGSGRLAKRDVHRIGILDIRLFNTDRHAGNILVCNPSDSGDMDTRGLRFGGLPGGVAAPYELVPIDHGFCLPEALEPPYFEWLHWPQAMLPFEQAELDYIAALDAAADVALLRSELPMLRPQCLKVLEVSTVFLQRCAAAGLSLAAMGNLMSRPLDALDDDDSNPSELERACVLARQAMEAALLGVGPAGSLDGSVAGLTVAEGDEEAEEQEGQLSEDDGCPLGGSAGRPAGPGQPAAVSAAAASSVAAATATAAVCSSSSGGDAHCAGAAPAGGPGRRDDGLGGLMFDLEPEGEGSTSSSDPARTGSSDLAAPQSPYSQLSVDSLGSGGGGPVPMSIGASAAGGMGVGRGGGEAGLAVARSVYAGNGFMWRPPPKAGGIRSQSPRRALGARAAYPPPVMAVPPRSTSEVLLGLSDAQWELFMAQLVAIIDDQLASDAWKQAAAAPMTVAMSCPRF